MPTPPKFERVRLLSDREGANQMVRTQSCSGTLSVQWCVSMMCRYVVTG